MPAADRSGSELGSLVGHASGATGILIQQVTAMVTDPAHGGLKDLVERLEQNGLGAVAASWIGQGSNLPITAGQLQSVIDPERLRQLAAHIGVSPEQVSTGLATMLPMIVDRLTPNGQIPGMPDLGR